MLNCTKGTIDDSNFSKPMPIIGLYIAGATLVCIILMVIDVVKGFMRKEFWMPASYFSIDAASLTVIGVAAKLSVDLNSPMPSQIDQLAKLATSAFICIVLVNILPSLGKLKKDELQANTIALAILIATSVVNLFIQLNTGVIHAFRIAHIVMIAMTFLVFIWCLLTASELPKFKIFSNLKFEKLHQQALQESFGDDKKNKKESVEMKEYLVKYLILAQSCCPHYVYSRSPAVVQAAFYGLVSASTLFVSIAATITHKDKMVGLNSCGGESDYRQSILLVLITQVIGVAVGLIAPLSRLMYGFMVETENPTFTSPLKNENQDKTCSIDGDPVEVNIDIMVESSTRVAQEYINAENGEPKHLIGFLVDYLSHDFGGVLSFENDKVPPLSSSDGTLSTCWALPVLTLTCIATALPNIAQNSKERLSKSLKEGLVYVELVEDIRAADFARVLPDADGKCRWFCIDLEYLAHNSKHPMEVLLSLANAAKEKFAKFFNLLENTTENDFKSRRRFACDVVAAHSMYRICETLLQDCQNEDDLDLSSDDLFVKLCVTIADILGACLTNLRQYILQECKTNIIEKRRETAFRMLKVFGETRRMMDILEDRDGKIPDLPQDKMVLIDEWRSYLKRHKTEEWSRIERNYLHIL